MIYCDTSVLIAALTDEDHSRAVRDWLAGVGNIPLAISGWSRVEFSSGVAIKLRTGQIDAAQRGRLLDGWDRLVAPSFTIVAIEARDFALARTLIDDRPGSLRAGDALHLAVTLGRNAGLATLDRAFAWEAMACGVSVERLTD